jgi:23S rRNA (guanosine2251-2'-O)-methyltransferase
MHAITEAIKAGKQIDKIVVRRGQDNPLTREMLSEARKLDLPIQFVPIEKIDYLCKQNHQGALAYISPIEYQKIDEIIPFIFDQGKTPFILVLDQITDVRNFGAICRSAECAGVDAIIVPDKGASPINADSIKTSAGALSIIPVCRTSSLDDTIKYLKMSGITIFAATEKTDNIYHTKDMTIPLALIIGSEDTGISASLLRDADEFIKIPLLGSIGSLNASVAASVLMYEVVRQRAV